MLRIDIPADLNWIDDEDRNIASLPSDHTHLTVGGVAVAGRGGLWSWVVIDEIDSSDGWIYFHQVDEAEARAHGELVEAVG